MASYTPIIPSGTVTGRLIEIATSSTECHDTVAGSVHMDEVFIYVTNTNANAVEVTIEVDGTATANQIIDFVPATSGLVLMLPGIRCQDATEIDIKAAETGCNALVIVNRIVLTEGLDGS